MGDSSDEIEFDMSVCWCGVSVRRPHKAGAGSMARKRTRRCSPAWSSLYFRCGKGSRQRRVCVVAVVDLPWGEVVVRVHVLDDSIHLQTLLGIQTNDHIFVGFPVIDHIDRRSV